MILAWQHYSHLRKTNSIRSFVAMITLPLRAPRDIPTSFFLHRFVTANQSASDLQNKLEDAQIQLARIMREESALSERYRALMRQMDFDSKELSDLREREKKAFSLQLNHTSRLDILWRIITLLFCFFTITSQW